jgi:hypothetical protein
MMPQDLPANPQLHRPVAIHELAERLQGGAATSRLHVIKIGTTSCSRLRSDGAPADATELHGSGVFFPY